MRPLALLITVLVASSAAAQTAPACAGSRDLRLVNGKFATMDAKNTTASEVTIQNGVFTAVGKGSGRLGPCTRTIDLKGRTAVPGLVDNHNHIVLLGLRPGYDTRLETAASIADVQALIRARAKTVPDRGQFITAMGGWNVAQLAEKRMPTLAELDAADADHPVIVYHSFTGPAAANTKAKAFFASKNVPVSDTGAIAINGPSLAALNALRAIQTLADQTRGTMDALAYSASVGVTTNVDMGAFVPPGLPDTQESFAADTLATANPFTMYNAITAIHRDGRVAMQARVR